MPPPTTTAWSSISRSRGPRPSPAILLAAVCLVFAVGATAVAGPEAISRALTKSKVKKIATKQANKAIGQRAAGLSVANSQNAANAQNAASLGGSPAADFAKEAELQAHGNVSDTNINDFTAGAFTSIISKSFTAPSDGFLLITGNVSAEDDSSIPGGSYLFFRLRLDASPVTDSGSEYELSSSGADNVGGNTGGASAVVPVTAGEHTVHLDAKEFGGGGSFIGGRDISVLFVPSGSGVTVPVR